jgi:hypothetical protein
MPSSKNPISSEALLPTKPYCRSRVVFMSRQSVEAAMSATGLDVFDKTMVRGSF